MIWIIKSSQDSSFVLLIIFLVFVLGILIGKWLYELYLLRKENKLEKRKQEVENQIINMIREAEQKAQFIIKEAEQKAQKQLEKIERLEEKITKKEEKIEKKLEEIEKQKKKLLEKEMEIEKLKNQWQTKLEEIAWLTKEEAKQYIIDEVKKEYEQLIKDTIAKYKQLMESSLNEEASKMIVKVLPRVAADVVNEYTVTTIDLPEETVKGKIIWREWRNIQHFEKVTGVELIVDDTPLVVRLSHYDPERRFIAAETLKRLLKDWRINPIYIEKTYEKVLKDMDNIFRKIGEETLSLLNLPMMHPEVVKMIWKMKLRYSYWQNLLNHSIEVAKISELIANELGLDGQLAKKAGLLHDIGKLLVESWQAHAKVWADFLRKYNIDPVVVDAAETHHFDVQPKYAISWIVAAADAISASRPGARFNTKDLFVERLENLERLISSIDGVDKVYIYQAWRQIIVFVDPNKVSDLELEEMMKKISEKIEQHLDYPGLIRIVVVRENKVSSFIK